MSKIERDIWLYRGDEGRIFRAGEDVPPASEGWLDRQTPAPDPFDHDGDGKPGGSLKAPRRRRIKE